MRGFGSKRRPTTGSDAPSDSAPKIGDLRVRVQQRIPDPPAEDEDGYCDPHEWQWDVESYSQGYGEVRWMPILVSHSPISFSSEFYRQNRTFGTSSTRAMAELDGCHAVELVRKFEAEFYERKRINDQFKAEAVFVQC